MPELPEVETVVRSLRAPLTGRTIQRLDIFDAKLDFPGRESLAGIVISGVERRGKFIMIEFGGSAPKTPAQGSQTLVNLNYLRRDVDAQRQRTGAQKPGPGSVTLAGSGAEPWSSFPHLVIHLRMTGRLLLADSGYAAVKHDRAVFRLNEGCLVFQDMRRFGTFKLETMADLDARLGPEPLGDEFTVAGFRKSLQGRRVPIKPLLLDQRLVAGIGNIYASEALFMARIHPERPAGELKPAEIKRLHGAIRDILQRAVDGLGTTYSTYLDGEGRAGTFQNALQVFQKTGEPCPQCGDSLERVVQAGRSTFFCGRCQK